MLTVHLSESIVTRRYRMFISVAIFVQHQHAIELKLQDFARFDEAELIEIDLATNLYKEKCNRLHFTM